MKFEYQGKEIKPEGAVRRYLKAVERKLCLPKDLRSRVLSDLLTTICARQEQGETTESILRALGGAKQTAAEFNEQLQEYTYHKSPWRFVCLIVSVLSALWLAGWALGQAFVWSLTHNNQASVGIIGGADGPTSIIVATNTNVFREGVAALVLLIVSIVGFCLLRKMKKK